MAPHKSINEPVANYEAKMTKSAFPLGSVLMKVDAVEKNSWFKDKDLESFQWIQMVAGHWWEIFTHKTSKWSRVVVHVIQVAPELVTGALI